MLTVLLILAGYAIVPVLAVMMKSDAFTHHSRDPFPGVEIL